MRMMVAALLAALAAMPAVAQPASADDRRKPEIAVAKDGFYAFAAQRCGLIEADTGAEVTLNFLSETKAYSPVSRHMLVKWYDGGMAFAARKLVANRADACSYVDGNVLERLRGRATGQLKVVNPGWGLDDPPVVSGGPDPSDGHDPPRPWPALEGDSRPITKASIAALGEAAELAERCNRLSSVGAARLQAAFDEAVATLPAPHQGLARNAFKAGRHRGQQDNSTGGDLCKKLTSTAMAQVSGVASGLTPLEFPNGLEP